ncbi:YdcF family protein [Gordonia sinesedis]
MPRVNDSTTSAEAGAKDGSVQQVPDPPRRRRLVRRILIGLSLTVVLAVLASVPVGYQLFVREHQDPLRKADAIVVLGGEHDGREDYGLQLAREGWASTVLISDPYASRESRWGPASAALMQRVCSSGTARIEVICFPPDPSTTRGEAMFVQRLAEQRRWSTVIVISWRYHLVRARYIFGQCFDGGVVMRSVPRSYERSPAAWLTQFAYQYGGLAKAAVLGCSA